MLKEYDPLEINRDVKKMATEKRAFEALQGKDKGTVRAVATLTLEHQDMLTTVSKESDEYDAFLQTAINAVAEASKPLEHRRENLGADARDTAKQARISVLAGHLGDQAIIRSTSEAAFPRMEVRTSTAGSLVPGEIPLVMGVGLYNDLLLGLSTRIQYPKIPTYREFAKSLGNKR